MKREIQHFLYGRFSPPMQEIPVARQFALRNLHKIQNGMVRALDTTQWETN